jgi:hypothetical protein
VYYNCTELFFSSKHDAVASTLAPQQEIINQRAPGTVEPQIVCLRNHTLTKFQYKLIHINLSQAFVVVANLYTVEIIVVLGTSLTFTGIYVISIFRGALKRQRSEKA